jgi:hypothetical protein
MEVVKWWWEFLQAYRSSRLLSRQTSTLLTNATQSGSKFDTSRLGVSPLNIVLVSSKSLELSYSQVDNGNGCPLVPQNVPQEHNAAETSPGLAMSI